ncbi:YmdB family metallophosphoesterase [Candidatus Peregrinibacteria bacterium]|nr:YmdB family metallophosphoesterase [Candidatus Peregrinibacteria bacterium]
MNILFIGDIFGRPGRETIQKIVSTLKKERAIDLVIANGENMAHGKGVNLKAYRELEKEIDLFTTGNHTWADEKILAEVNKENTKILRPANFPPGNHGKGFQVIEKERRKILVINLIGRVFSKHHYDCPFRTVDGILKQFEHKKMDAILIDFHAEATSEKIAMKHFVNGRVTALFGTHTHVQTADAEITSEGMAYMTDVGMVGPADSVIGIEKNEIVKSFIYQTPFKIVVPSGPCIFNAVMIEVDEKKAHTKAISPIHFFLKNI